MFGRILIFLNNTKISSNRWDFGNSRIIRAIKNLCKLKKIDIMYIVLDNMK